MFNIDISCPTDYELIGVQFVKCIYDGSYKWSDEIPYCKSTKIIEPPIEPATEPVNPTLGPDMTIDQTTAHIDNSPQDGCAEKTSFAFECLTKIQVVFELFQSCIMKKCLDNHCHCSWRNNCNYYYCSSCCLLHEKPK